MNLALLLETLMDEPRFRSCVEARVSLPARPASYAPFPEWVDPRLKDALAARGITQLYSHQAEAVEMAHACRHVVVVTPTASGKTLTYNLPVLSRILENPDARALYLFPTKALSQDQVAEVHELITAVGADIKTFTYDGDTPQSARKAIRSAGHIVVTNPDMLHTGILPHHTKWVKLFENLETVVIDELHHYRGVFGSHVANVIRRLKRICAFYGSHPAFILCSATIANPGELASRLTGEDVTVVDRNGAPSGPKEFVFYNPPVVNKELGIRRGSVLEARDVATRFIKNDIRTIVFARSRVTTEVLLTYLKEAVSEFPGLPEKIRGYRGGYLPLERREIERGLRQGRLLGVVSTDALELGVDIGTLQACVMVGYPGSVASTWQQAGRAGRRQDLSCAVMVGSSAPLDQYIMSHPDYFFGRAPEHGLINPDNLYILLSHLKCAAFELPFAADETFAGGSTPETLAFLAEQGILHRSGDKYHWADQSFPAEAISLRSAANENFIIIDITDEGRRRVIGEVDRFAAPMLVHQEAIYIHGGQQYHVDLLDYKEKKAYVKEVKVDYYTDANLAVDLKVLDVFESKEGATLKQGLGEVLVTAVVTMFKKIKLHTHENIGWGRLHYPEEQVQTAATWFSVPAAVAAKFSPSEMETALAGVANVLANVAPLLLLCDPRDLHVVPQVRAPFTEEPTVYFHDHYPGGIGLAEKLYEVLPRVWKAAEELVDGCKCDAGCPSCVGPATELGPKAKGLVRRLLAEARPA